MYLALEGIKGAGKSTLLESLAFDKISNSKDVRFFPITASMPARNPMEILFNSQPLLQANDDFMELLFLQRAIYHNPKDKEGLIIGDRSLTTAIVTRWEKWKDPYYTIKKVKREYDKIIKPDVIIYLESPISVSIQNISQRAQKKTGIKDEKYVELCKAADVYHELLFDGLYEMVFSKTQIIKIPYSPSQSDIKTELYSIIKFYNK